MYTVRNSLNRVSHFYLYSAFTFNIKVHYTEKIVCVCVYSLTVKICQFFNIIPQVSRHWEGLSHLQVSLSEEEKPRK